MNERSLACQGREAAKRTLDGTGGANYNHPSRLGLAFNPKKGYYGNGGIQASVENGSKVANFHMYL